MIPFKHMGQDEPLPVEVEHILRAQGGNGYASSPFTGFEEQVDLRIVEHLDMQNLPESIQNMLSLAKTDQEKDMLLMATLAAASACVPNLYFRYGPTGKKYYANLQCFILASSASGKGIANQALEMMRGMVQGAGRARRYRLYARVRR